MITFLLSIESPEDKSKFERLYLLYRNKMYYVAYDILKNSQLAENIVHDAFVVLIDHLDKIEEVESAKTWGYLNAIVKSRAYNYYKREKKMSYYGDVSEELFIDRDEPLDILINQDIIKELKNIIKGLPSPYKEVLYLQYYNELTGEEIAVIMGKTPENVRQIVKRAKQKIKLQLKERGYYGGNDR
ncbi:MAG: sigma-70 family RNA polymerase sigma factor [Lachnospiraceae bacterium]|nr:sigma-70 family RNA polymerase sigma factor [Lachnospiraceae bacterium]